MYLEENRISDYLMLEESCLVTSATDLHANLHPARITGVPGWRGNWNTTRDSRASYLS